MKEHTRSAKARPSELKIDAKRLIEEMRPEDVVMRAASNSISQELAAKIRNKYFPKKDDAAKRPVKVVKQGGKSLKKPTSGKTHEDSAYVDIGEITVTGEEFVYVTIPREQFDLLSGRTEQILVETALAQERITKDQVEIELLKTETREILKRLSAA